MAEQTYAVKANRLNLRREPGLEAGILAVLNKGQTVAVQDGLSEDWWKVRPTGSPLEGYVARRYLAQLSLAPSPVPREANAALWSATETHKGRVAYKLGAKHSSQGRIDCSGWVAEITRAAFDAVNAAARPEVVFDRSDYAALETHSDGIISQIEGRTGLALHGAAVVASALREGMLIGCNFGEHSWEQNTPPRVYGVDHIVQVIRSPGTGELWISQSSSSGGGVNSLLLADWLKGVAALAQTGRLHAVDPFLMADRNGEYLRLVGETAGLEPPPQAATPAFLAPASTWAGPPTISDDAWNLIVEFETGGRNAYERKYIHPVWPGASSGVTIGIGHDLAFTTPEAFDRNWAALPLDARTRLKATIGLTRSAAKAAIPGLSDIVVPWVVAEAVYRSVDLPATIAKTHAALPNCDQLSGDCFGVLVSLTFNRGADYTSVGKPIGASDSRAEMRAIRLAMADRNFAAIPALLRSMIRVWRNTDVEAGLTRRREAEAALFEKGLRESVTVAPSLAHAPEASLVSEVAQASTPDEAWSNTTQEEAVAKASAAPDDAAEHQADILARSQVIWASDAKAIDYAHLQSVQPPGGRFAFRADDLEALARLNDFVLDTQAPILFGLRGCGLIQASDGFQDEAILLDRRPDHQSARCVMGVWDRAAGKIAVFPASTVPNAKAVVGWTRTHEAGNMLPTGLYRYITGEHNGKPGCFVLRKTPSERRVVVVRRSSNDLRYERTDMFDVCAPGDNIHPTFYGGPDNFSSVGCQVVVGSATPGGVHSGPWAKFRAAAGLPARGAASGSPYLYMLLTGAEALLASGLRRRGLASDAPEWRALRRLRFGSSGEAVLKLQQRLALSGPDGSFGPNTSSWLHKLQAERFEGNCDGVYSPALDEYLEWRIL